MLSKLSVLAGMFISIGAMFSMSVAQYSTLAQGICFSVGLFLVISVGAKLFTGNVLRVLDVWSGKLKREDMLASWYEIWLFNLVGCMIVAFMAYVMGYDASEIAKSKAETQPIEMLLKAMLCNVLVCAACGMGNASDTHHERLAACLLPVACFVTCGFEHSVADMFYMSLGMLNGAVGIFDAISVIFIATVGNILGGVGLCRLLRAS